MIHQVTSRQWVTRNLYSDVEAVESIYIKIKAMNVPKQVKYFILMFYLSFLLHNFLVFTYVILQLITYNTMVNRNKTYMLGICRQCKCWLVYYQFMCHRNFKTTNAVTAVSKDYDRCRGTYCCI